MWIDDASVFALLGLATGALTALVALGIVVVYRASGVVNFSATAMGAIGAYACYSLHDNDHLATPAAVVIGLFLGAAMGLITHAAMWLLRSASLLARLIVTLGLFTSAQAFILIVWGANVSVPHSFLPSHLIRIGSGSVGEDRIFLIGIALVLAVVLVVVYSRTLFGLATSAVSESRRFSAASGWSPGTIEAANHVIAGVLSAGAAIFLAPIIGLSGAAFAAVILPALAAALVGRFSSFTVTVVAALLIGIAESELSLYEADIARAVKVSALSLSSAPSAVPLLVIVLLMIARGRGQLQRGESQAKLPLPGSGRVSILPLAFGAVFALVVLSRAAGWGDPLIAMSGAGILLVSIVLLTGFTGQLSLCQFALAGMGGWVAAVISQDAGIPYLLCLVCGVAAASALGLLVALPAFRTRGINLAIVTLALALLLYALVFTNSSLTGGFNGILVKTPKIAGYNLDPLQYPVRYAILGLILFILAGLVVSNLRRGVSGRRLLAVREDERAAASLGVGVYGAKLFSFGVSSAIAGLAGVYLSFQFPSAQFTGFDSTSNMQFVQNSVLGGLGWVSGTPVGAMASTGSVLSHAVTDKLSAVSNVDSWVALVSTLALIVVLRGSPDGIAAVWARAFGSADAEGRRRALSWPVPAWRAIGLAEMAVGIVLVVAVIEDSVLLYAAVAAIVLLLLELATGIRGGAPRPESAGTCTLLVVAVILCVLHGSGSVAGELYCFIAGQAVAFPLLARGSAKLSGRLMEAFRLPRPGSASAGPAGTGPAGSEPGAKSRAPRRREPMELELRNITMKFGGVTALQDVSLTLRSGEVLGLMGPNGAGKTTLLDVATGFTRPTSGTLLIDGQDATGWGAAKRARTGLVRSWQGVELFDCMTVRDNLLVAADPKRSSRYLLDLLRPGRPHMTAVAEAAGQFHLESLLGRRPSELSQGATRLAGIARAVAAEPRALLLDEPGAGLDQAESSQLARAIRQIAEKYGIGVLVVEHDVPMMMQLCDRLVVLDFGRTIAEGTPGEVASNPLVTAAYLGSADVATGEPAASISARESDSGTTVGTSS